MSERSATRCVHCGQLVAWFAEAVWTPDGVGHKWDGLCTSCRMGTGSHRIREDWRQELIELNRRMRAPRRAA